jgi:hypothetical protein
MSKRAWGVVRRLASLRLAVVVLASLAVVLAVATVIESKWGSETARRYVYGATWFSLFLVLLSVNVAAATILRWPWRLRHIGFLVTHAGLLVVLGGCLTTNLLGINGRLALEEGMQDDRIVVDEWVIRARAGQKETSEAEVVIGHPPRVGRFRSFELGGQEYHVRVVDYLADAEAVQRVVEGGQGDPAAVQVEIRSGGHVWQEWLVVDGGGPWSIRTAGFGLRAAREVSREPAAKEGKGTTSVTIVPGADRLTLVEQYAGEVMQQGDLLLDAPVTLKKMSMVLVARKYLPHARASVVAVPHRAEQGTSPQPAVQVEIAGGDWRQPTWLLWAQPASVGSGPGKIDLVLQAGEVALPFAVRLNRFDIEEYPGTKRPAMFRSNVTVSGPQGREAPAVDIEMNRPLEYDGWSFFQSSYSFEGGRRVSVLAASKDPGQTIVFWGSALLVAGTVILACQRLWQQGDGTKMASGGATPGRIGGKTNLVETDYA